MYNPNYLASRWRPIVAVVYAFIVLFDFVFAPILWGVLIYLVDGDVIQWNPLTLDQGGIFHIGMSAVLGITAWSRGQEKIAGVDADAGQPRTTPK